MVSYLIGDALQMYSQLPPNSVELVMTSPPFLNLRNYLPDDHDDKAAEIGRGSPAQFISTLLDHVAWWRRVLSPYGSIVIELGDTYSGSGGAGGDYNTGFRRGTHYDGSARTPDGWPLKKSKAMIPELLGVALAYGIHPLTGGDSPAGKWRVRNVVTWCRPNPPVGSTGDKFRVGSSSVIIACLSDKRSFDMEPVRTPTGAPPLDWWAYSANRTKERHFATYPGVLCRIPILSMCPKAVCRQCCVPRRRALATQCYLDGQPIAGVRHGTIRGLPADTKVDHKRYTTTRITTGWQTCDCDEGFRPGMVLDPFAGTGTTLAVAAAYGRAAIGFDINPEGLKMFERRQSEVNRELFGTRWHQLSLDDAG